MNRIVKRIIIAPKILCNPLNTLFVLSFQIILNQMLKLQFLANCILHILHILSPSNNN